MRGKRSQGTSAVRPARALLAVALTLSAANACGSRSTLIEEETGDDAGGTGGTAWGGTSAQAANGGKGAVTGTGGSPASGGGFGRGGTGGSGAVGGVSIQGGTYGRGGGSTRGGAFSAGGAGSPAGGSYGRGGTGVAGYPSGAGGTVSYGGYSGRGTSGSPGRGGRGAGAGGTMVYGGRPGRGGSAGSSGAVEGGAAGEAGTGGTGGFYGSPAVLAACDELCRRNPPVCSEFPTDETECRSSCYPAAYQSERCELELADYASCLARGMNPSASCTLSNGGCYGPGCTTTAIEACGDAENTYTSCQNYGCNVGVGLSPESCSYESICSTHSHSVYCTLTDSTSNAWGCTCYVDGYQTFSEGVYGAGTASCQSLVTACNFSR